MDVQLSPEQMEKALKLCDVMSLEDFTVATVILEQAGWDLQKALASVQQNSAEVIPPPPPPPQQYIPYDFDEQPEEYEYEEYEEAQQQEQDFENKKKMFENEYESIPLNKTTSQIPNKLEHRISVDRLLSDEYSNHRQQYHANLLDNSERFCQKILNSKSPESRRVYESKKKNETNRKFISELHKKYKTRINFTFGTLLLNLARSYLDKKYLLVYIHNSKMENNRSIEMLLTQRQIANFINKNCISYGMFDSSDDYEIVQKYVPMKDLPAFVLFNFNKKQQKQNFISSYVILQKDAENFMEWLAVNMGVPIKKKPVVAEPPVEDINSQPGIKISDIIYEQNLEYEEMAKLYEIRRQASQMKKVEKAKVEQQIQSLKSKFQAEPEFLPGQTIEIKFRLPLSGKSLLRIFKNSECVSSLFDYINCFGRDQFEQQYAQFDLTQTFPRLSLADRKEEKIIDVFPDSDRENIIVKEI